MRFKDSMVFSSPQAEVELRALGLNTVEDVLSYRGGRYAAISSTSDTLEILPPGNDATPVPDEPPATVYVKRYRYRKRSQRLKDLLRGWWLSRTRARFEYDRLYSMRLKGLPAIEPLAAGERRIAGLPVAAILITRGVPSPSLLSFVRTRETWSSSERQHLTRSLARHVRGIHSAGVVHGSMFWRDILVQRSGEGEFRFLFLDPGHVGRFSVPGLRRIGFLRDLLDLAGTAMLLCRRTDRLRFFKAYVGRQRLTQADRRTLTVIQRLVRGRVAQEQHRLDINDIFLPPAT